MARDLLRWTTGRSQPPASPGAQSIWVPQIAGSRAHRTTPTEALASHGSSALPGCVGARLARPHISAPDHHTRSRRRAVLRARLRPSPRMAPGERCGLVRQVDMKLGVGETAGVGRREDATLPWRGDFTLNPNTPTVDVLVGSGVSRSTARARTKRHRTARSARDLNSDRRGPRVSASAQRVPPGQVFRDSPCLTVLWITGSPLPVREKVR